jgi:hypothetical protein
MSNVKFSQLPDLPGGSITPATIVPVVEGGVNYTVTTANLQSYVNSTTGNVTAGNVSSTGIVSATGNVRGGNLNTGGVVSATGNITGSFFLGNGSQLTGLPAVYGNANVANFLANYGSNTISSTGNVTANIITASANIDVGAYTRIRGNSLSIQTIGTNGTVTADIINGLQISASGNITGNYILGNGSQLTGLPATYGNANVTTLLANLGSNTISSTGNITTTANIAGGFILGNGSQLTGLPATYGNANVTTLLASFGSNTISSTGNITTTANIAGGFFLGNGSQLTGLPATYGDANVTTLLASFGSNTISTTSNITGANLNATTNITTANANIGNVSIVGSITNNINAFNASLNPNPFRLIYGNGYNGDYSGTSDPLGVVRNSLLTIQTKQTSTSSDANPGVRGYSGLTYNDLNGQTHTNNQRRGAGSGSVLWLGNGTMAMTATQYLGASGAGGTVVVGNIGTVSMGNATIGHATGAFNLVISGGGANIGNAVGVIGQIQTQSANANVTTAIGAGVQFTAPTAPTVPPTTVIGYYMPNNTATYGLTNSNSYRGATNYYFLKNDDNAAQAQLGSVRAYHEFEAATATSGSFAIDKAVAQVHNIVPVGNCTITGYNNMVVSASDGTNNDPQIDTLTIVVEQGATPYTVTLPTGAAFKYAGGNSTVGTTANAVTIVTVVAANVSGTTTYMTTVSPEFV